MSFKQPLTVGCDGTLVYILSEYLLTELVSQTIPYCRMIQDFNLEEFNFTLNSPIRKLSKPGNFSASNQKNETNVCGLFIQVDTRIERVTKVFCIAEAKIQLFERKPVRVAPSPPSFPRPLWPVSHPGLASSLTGPEYKVYSVGYRCKFL